MNKLRSSKGRGTGRHTTDRVILIRTNLASLADLVISMPSTLSTHLISLTSTHMQSRNQRNFSDQGNTRHWPPRLQLPPPSPLRYQLHTSNSSPGLSPPYTPYTASSFTTTQRGSSSSTDSPESLRYVEFQDHQYSKSRSYPLSNGIDSSSTQHIESKSFIPILLPPSTFRTPNKQHHNSHRTAHPKSEKKIYIY